MELIGKNISIIGAVRSGIGAAKLAKKVGAIPFVSDSGSKEKIMHNLEVLESESIPYETGKHSDRVYECDLMVVSPGVPDNAEIIVTAKEKNIKIISELEFASYYCSGRVIAITGTNGKTTVTSLCGFVLNNAGKKCYIAGNIGNAFSEIAADTGDLDYVALEVSSFQLDHADTFKPEFSIILNITPDHLDRYENNFEKYAAAKFRIFENQDESDYYIYNGNDETLVNNLYGGSTKIPFFLNGNNEGAYISGSNMMFNDEVVCSVSDLFIKGEHNTANALSLIPVFKIIGLTNEEITDGFKKFPGVEHRLELVRELRGVQYINDSKATNVESVWYALRSFDKPLHLILGGKDKGNDYRRILDSVNEHVKKIYAIGESAKKVYAFFSCSVDVEICITMEEAVKKAYNQAVENEIVLLSPACASFDMFENYEHRGKVFKEAVNSL